MNVLVIFSDQQHKYALGKVNPEFITPNLDALAEDGVLFKNGYSPNPVCGPYRGCLMTGQYTSRCGVYNNCFPLPEGVPTIADRLKDAGYFTSYVGKWHLGGNGQGPIEREIRGGFEDFIGYQCYNGFDVRPPYSNKVLFYDENDEPHEFQKHRTDVTTDLAIERLDCAAAKGKPFLMMVSYQAPHYPEQPLDEYARLYEGKVFTKTPDYSYVDPYTPTFSPYSPRPFDGCPDYQRYGGDMDEYMRLYAGMVTQVDAGVGRITDELKRLNIYDDTLIIYTSDHGDMQGSHGLKNKCYPHEKSAGVPFIARYPGGRRGVISEQLVSGVDILPTALDAAGLKGDDSLDGRSFLDYLKGASEETNGYIISEYVIGKEPWRMIRTPEYKLTVTMRDYSPISLYRMTDDEWELNDIKDEAFAKPIIEEMTQTLKAHTLEVTNAEPTPEQMAKWYPKPPSAPTGNS
ncbi:MAG: sulfatase-like hydrolase/transferase [Clostridia bacterium]|nr:sulfatase-like hydrolase/transferase [Clostridia bacterium]